MCRRSAIVAVVVVISANCGSSASNAAARELGLRYSQLIAVLQKANIALDRKTLSEMAIADPNAFAEVVKLVKKAIGRRNRRCLSS